MPLLAQERYNAILRALIENNTIKVSQVMALCGVSHETARRDLEVLQENGVAKRVHGGAMLLPQSVSGNGVSFQIKDLPHKSQAENVVVARAAAQMIRPGDTIFLDNGRTMQHLAEAIRDVSDLTVLTPSLAVINTLNGSSTKVVSLGGELLQEEDCFIGALTQRALSSYNVDKAFLSCAALHLRNGYLMDYDTYGLPRQLIRDHSDEMILVTNSEKLHSKAFVNVFPLSQIDTLVIDSDVSEDDIEWIRNKGLNLIIAPMEPSADDNGKGAPAN